MIAKSYKGKPKKLAKYLTEEFDVLSYSAIMKLLRKKDVKINGKRVHENVELLDGDIIEIFISEEQLNRKQEVDIVYEDENIIIINKKAGIEIENENQKNLTNMVSCAINKPVRPCHRLDRNTTGLIIFAKTDQAYDCLFKAFKNRTIKKFYKAKVFGKPKKQETLIAYLKKDEQKAQVYISSDKKQGYTQIETRYKLLEKNDDIATLEVELVTGKTHQIRAHLAHVGLPIVGDSKYGNNSKNRDVGKKRQELVAYKIVFNFEKESPMAYLNNKVISI